MPSGSFSGKGELDEGYGQEPSSGPPTTALPKYLSHLEPLVPYPLLPCICSNEFIIESPYDLGRLLLKVNWGKTKQQNGLQS